VLAQILLYTEAFATRDVATKEKMLTVRVLPKKLDEEVAAEMVKGFSGQLTRLKATQAKYINVEVDGPFKDDTYRY
jgi:adenosylhomocysteinase